MPTTILASEWDDSPWDDGGTGTTSIAVNDTFNVAVVDMANRIVRLTPLSSAYSGTALKCVYWGDSTWWADPSTVASHFTLNQTFTVTSIDLANRVVVLSG